MMQKKLTAALVLGALASTSQVAQATDVFHLEGIGAISRGMGGTAVAHDVGPGGMLTNPATLALSSNDRQAMVGFDLVTTDITVTNQRTGETASSETHANNRGPYLAPEAAYTQRIGDLVFGVGAFARGGLGTEYGRNSFLSRGHDINANEINSGTENSSRLLVLDIPLAASYKVNDALTLGASIDAMWQGLNLDLFLRTDQVLGLLGDGRVQGPLTSALGGLVAPGTLTGTSISHSGLQGAHFSLTKDQMLGSGVDAWGYTGRLGMLYQASPATRLGASYQLKSQMNDMEGNATLTAVVGTDGGGSISVPIHGKIKILDFQMPAKLDVGVSHKLSDQWSVAMDVSRVFWKDVMKDIKVAFLAEGGPFSGQDINIQLPQNYKDQTILALGTAYALSKEWTLRAGARFATQALRDNTLFAVIPATPTKHLSFGFSYAVTPTSKIDFAYSHALAERMTNSVGPNTGDPIEVKHSQNNATLNYTLSF